MDYTWTGLTEQVWISRFWAQYSKLPESLKKGFIGLAQNVAREAESRKGEDPVVPNAQYGDIGE
jgi:hypothetical protein